MWGDSIVLMGKNTMMKRSIRLYCERTGNRDLEQPARLPCGQCGPDLHKGRSGRGEPTVLRTWSYTLMVQTML